MTDKWAKAAPAISEISKYDDTSKMHPVVCKIITAARRTVSDIVVMYGKLVADIAVVQAGVDESTKLREKYRAMDRTEGGCNSDYRRECLINEIGDLVKRDRMLTSSINASVGQFFEAVDRFIYAVSLIEFVSDAIDQYAGFINTKPVNAMLAVYDAEKICDGLRLMNKCFNNYLIGVDEYATGLWRDLYAAVGSDDPDMVVVSIRRPFSKIFDHEDTLFMSSRRCTELPREHIPRERVECNIYPVAGGQYAISDPWTCQRVTDEPLWAGIMPAVRMICSPEWILHYGEARVSVIGYNTAKAK